MSLILAGRFNGFQDAEHAQKLLLDQGVLAHDTSIFFVSPRGMHDQTPIGGDRMADEGTRQGHAGMSVGIVAGAIVGGALGLAIARWAQVPPIVVLIGAALGAYLGSLAGTMVGVRHRPGAALHPDPALRTRESGVLLAVHTNDAGAVKVAHQLRAAGAQDVERAQGHWANGTWSDFDPTATPQPAQAQDVSADPLDEPKISA